ncbi:uncharacterized protein DSM5745_04804 [Aspergillus mulundensis]|uniref:RZ-type domain-containing protein n=1 Tax=Aspergillus mulundensis TaxID=1810919 RepID=A0A3D8S4M6_9EURO|nr:hypothetical protein DSM5745_04804 [Aspergillus mulundensis]RDW81247.1 hypothetical protein DSM5745_04804 [Aspergillus mulundensis]
MTGPSKRRPQVKQRRARGRGQSRDTSANLGRRGVPKGGPSRVSTRSTPTYASSTGNRRDEGLLAPAVLKEFLTATLKKIELSEEARNAAINDLATEDGLAQVRRIVETKFSAGYSVTTPMFDPHCVLFLRLITHKNVLQSLAVEKAVGTIYNVIYGLNGNRGVSFFRTAMDCLNSENRNPGEISCLEAFLLVSRAFLHLLTSNQGAFIRPEFEGLAESFSSLYMVEDGKARGSSDPQLSELYENVHKILDFLAMGDRLTTAASNRNCSSSGPKHRDMVKRATPVDLPGGLSRLGARHDNDHALIGDIRILPTLSEIYHQERTDFLPSRMASSSSHHQEGILRVLDSQFRLLREDTSGQVRDAVRLMANHWNTLAHGENGGTKRKIIRRESPTPLRIYYGAWVRKLKADLVHGLHIEVEFDQPPRIRKANRETRRKYWLGSRGLREGGGLVALVDAEVESDMNVIIVQVLKRDVDSVQCDQPAPVQDLINDGKRAMITLRFPSLPTKDDLFSLDYMQTLTHERERPLLLVEFPVVQYNQFEGILRCLQALHKDPSHIPFTRWLTTGARSSHIATNTATIPPPRYLRGTTLDLSSIYESDRRRNDVALMLSAYEDPNKIQQRLCELSSLDTGQAEAMISALTHEVALIQGPPGTGKSYVGIQIAKCLLRNKERLALGPLLCVCYTNHALDQFLTELANAGVEHILRIGSRSLSDHMESLSIDSYKKRGDIPRLPGFGRRINESKCRLDALAGRIQSVCQELERGPLAIAAGVMAAQFSEFAVLIQEGNPDMPESIKAWVEGHGPGDMLGIEDTERSIDQLFAAAPWTLTNEERSRVYRYCYNLGIEIQMQRLQALAQEHALEKQHHTALFIQQDAQIFDQVDVVGVTTTGLANNADLLRSLQAKVLICEEAGEVLESHLLTALLPSIEHAILIGDHLQLRPRISRRYLSMEYDTVGPKYNLDESLFERLANVKLTIPAEASSTEEQEMIEFPVAQLDHQRRMHPCISSLIRQTLYPKLKDHPTTTSYPEVAGFRRRLFWLDHNNVEDPGDPEDPTHSKSNAWEADMVTALVGHLCRQGVYKPGQIAVLTPYVSQLKLLEERLEKSMDLFISEDDLADLGLEDERNGITPVDRVRTVQKGSVSNRLRMATVDNFQGEEATVVIISLVRSNPRQNCGFLKTPNRINVLLSRAKHGMYIIGNAQTSCHVPMWEAVIKMLEADANIGPKIELQCSRHPEIKIHVSTPDDFARCAPEGGCSEKCGLRLKCGHTCTFKCHSKKLHEAVKCMEPCTVPRDCGHTLAVRLYLVGMFANRGVEVAGLLLVLSTMGAALLNAAGRSPHVHTTVCSLAMMEPRASRAADRARYDVYTISVQINAVILALLAPKLVVGAQCGSSEVLERQVEFIMLQKYAEIDVNEDPMIFLSCGHFYTRSTLDGLMEMKDHYDVDPITGEVLQPKAAWRVVMTRDAPGCPECRGSLREIHRYNRIVKRSLLDESTRRFASKAHREYIQNFKALGRYEDRMEKTMVEFIEKWGAAESGDLGFEQINSAVDEFEAKNHKMQQTITRFINQVRKFEQPIGRVNALIASAMARKTKLSGSETPTPVLSLVEETAIVTGFEVQGECLLLRLLWNIMSASERVHQTTAIDARIRVMVRKRLCGRLPNFMAMCRTVLEKSTKEKLPAEQLQAMVYLAQSCQLLLSTQTETVESTASREEIGQILSDCERLYDSFPGPLARFKGLIEGAKNYYATGAFYVSVSAEERRQVYEAMEAQFLGTGHWYYCVNNHPFTVGECGMPMEEARCPQCGERVGGHDHTPVAGVQRADDLDAAFSRAA